MNVAPQRPHKSETGIRNASISFFGYLDTGELLTGTPLVVEVGGTNDLTFSSIRINTADIVINDFVVVAGQAVLVSIANGLQSNSPYKIKITVSTSAATSQTIVVAVLLDVVLDA